MKLITTILFILVGQTAALAQPVYFNNRYNNDNWSFGLSILESGSEYVVAGCSGVESIGYVYRRILLSAVDHQGNQLWWKTFGEDFHNYYAGLMRGCIKTSDGGYAISGSVEDSLGTSALLIKFDLNGDSIWSRLYGDPIIPGFEATYFRACVQLPDHGYIITGGCAVIYGDEDILLVRTDSSGNMIWYQQYGDSMIVEDGGSIALLPDGGFLVGFQWQDVYHLNTADPGMLKVDSLGNQVWRKLYGGNFDDFGCAVAVSQDGNYLSAGTYALSEPAPGYPLQKICIFKTDTSGNIIWEGKYSEALMTGEGCTIDELEDGTIIASGHGGFDDDLNTQGYIIKVDQDGDSIWMRRYNYYPDNEGYLNDLYGLHLTNDNGIIFTGYVLGYPEWEQSMWVQKLDSIGCDSVKCDTTVGLPQLPQFSGYSGISVYPNPATDRVIINLRHYRPDFFSHSTRHLEFYNMFGEKMAETEMTLFRETYIQDVTDFPPGLYLVLINDGHRVLWREKFMVAR